MLPDTRLVPLGYRYQGTLYSVENVPPMFTLSEYIYLLIPSDTHSIELNELTSADPHFSHFYGHNYRLRVYLDCQVKEFPCSPFIKPYCSFAIHSSTNTCNWSSPPNLKKVELESFTRIYVHGGIGTINSVYQGIGHLMDRVTSAYPSLDPVQP